MKTQNPISNVQISEAMTRRVETLSPSDTIKDAVTLMMDSKLSTVPVVDGENRCIGILSRNDLTEMFLNEDNVLASVLDTDRLSLEWLNRSLDTGDVKMVKELMTYDVTTLRSDQNLSDACREMTRHKIHHLPVVDDQNKVIGIVSTFDVVTSIANG